MMDLSKAFDMVSSGVPQGSCLGPLPFLIYMNDVLNVPLEGELYLFADDSATFYVDDDVTQNCLKMESDLVTLSNYFSANDMRLNFDKTKVIHFTSKKRVLGLIPQVTFQNKVIERVKSFRYLGLILDEHLSFEEHSQQVAKSIRPWAAVINRLKKRLPRAQLFYQSKRYIIIQLVNLCFKY